MAGNRDRIGHAVAGLKEKGVAVSLFVDPDEAQVSAALAVMADMIEIHTGRYSDAAGERAVREELTKIISAAQAGKSAGLGVNAGHGLHYDNVLPIVQIPEIDDLSIGHSIIARAVLVGLDRAVRDMIALIRKEQ